MMVAIREGELVIKTVFGYAGAAAVERKAV
jgi:hypothetical protein